MKQIYEAELAAWATVGTGAFESGFQTSNLAVASAASVRFICDKDDLRRYFDADGSGVQAAVLVATLQQVATVTVGDFLFY